MLLAVVDSPLQLFCLLGPLLQLPLNLVSVLLLDPKCIHLLKEHMSVPLMCLHPRSVVSKDLLQVNPVILHLVGLQIGQFLWFSRLRSLFLVLKHEGLHLVGRHLAGALGF